MLCFVSYKKYLNPLNVIVCVDFVLNFALFCCCSKTVFRAAGNTKLQIKKNGEVVKEGDCVVNSSSLDDFEDFWISFAKSTISVGRVGLDMQPAFVSWSDTSSLEVSLAAFKGASSSYLVYYKFEYQTGKWP